MFKRSYVEKELFPVIRQHQMGFMSWGSLEKGILTGRVTRDRKFDQHDARARAPWWTKVDHEPKFKAYEAMKDLFEPKGFSGLEVALGYIASQKEVSTILCGIKNIEQLQNTAKVFEHLPPQDLIDDCSAIAARV